MKALAVLVLSCIFSISAEESKSVSPSVSEFLKATRYYYEGSPSDHPDRKTVEYFSAPERAKIMADHFADPDVTIDDEYLRHIAVWSAENDSQFIRGIFHIGPSSFIDFPVDSRDADGVSRKKRYLAKLADCIDSKVSEAFMHSFITLIRECPQLILSKTTKNKFAEYLDAVSADTQRYALDCGLDWKRITSDTLITKLKSMALSPLPVGFAGHGANLQPKTLALKHYYELNPGDARRIILEQLRKHDPEFDHSALTLLPDKELPELTADFRKILRSPYGSGYFDNVLPCIERYGTADLLPDIMMWYEPYKGRWACSVQTSAIRYFLKHDRQIGYEALRDALSFRGSKFSRCYASELCGALRGDTSEDAKKIALEFIIDKDDEIGICAVRKLIEFPDGIAILKEQLATNKNLSKSTKDYCKSAVDDAEREKKADDKMKAK